MAQGRAERLLNLTIALLSARGYLTKHEIRERVAGYGDSSDAAFERTFERDKDELRKAGITISVGQNADRGAEEQGYRILRDEFELPPVQFTPEEAAVIAVASRAWDQAELAGAPVTAAHKLAADLGESDVTVPWDAMVTVPEGVFAPVAEAVHTQTVLRFDYRNSRGETTQRHIEPWGMSQSRGAWYVTGRDRMVGERRTFKLDRVAGHPAMIGRSNAFEVPADFDMRSITQSLQDRTTSSAVVALRPGTEAALLRRSQPSEQPRPVNVPPDWLVVEVPYGYRPGLVGELAAAAGNIVVLQPSDIRDDVIRHWRGIA